MTCLEIQRRLTSYLDGEVEGDRGSVVRGHLRECEACRRVASQEAALRDGLRALGPLEPPAALWAGVQARLAAAEVADARRPGWRRALTRLVPSLPRFAAGGLVAAAALSLLWWRAQRGGEDTLAPSVAIRDLAVPAARPSLEHNPIKPLTLPSDDISADLATEATRTTATYAQAADELIALANDARQQWPEDRKDAFDIQLTSLRSAIDQAPEGRPRQRAWRTLIHYLQGAVVRDDITFAGGMR